VGSPLYKNNQQSLSLKELETKRRDIWKVKRVKTEEHHYHASLQRLMASREEVEPRTRKDRQREWLKVAVNAFWLRHMYTEFREHRKKRIKAANDIRVNWRIFMLRRYIHILAYLCTCDLCVPLRFHLWIRITRKQLAARKLVMFCKDLRKVRNGASVLPVFRKVRYKVLKAQRLVRDYLVCKYARLYALGKKWDKVEREDKRKQAKNTSTNFREMMASKSGKGGVCGKGGALEGIEAIDKHLNRAGQAEHKFANPRQERLFNKVKEKGREAQMHGYREAKFEVLQFFLTFAREAFQSEMKSVISDVVKRRSERKAAAIAAARAGAVTKHEIESMRSMLNMGELTSRKKIADYMLDFKMGNTGQRSLRQELPTFLMFKYITRDKISDIIKSANRRGRAHATPRQSERYFRLGSLVSLMDGNHPGEQSNQLAAQSRQNSFSRSAPNSPITPPRSVSRRKQSKVRQPNLVSSNGWMGTATNTQRAQTSGRTSTSASGPAALCDDHRTCGSCTSHLRV
jgi:hypothetical protein